MPQSGSPAADRRSHLCLPPANDTGFPRERAGLAGPQVEADKRDPKLARLFLLIRYLRSSAVAPSVFCARKTIRDNSRGYEFCQRGVLKDSGRGCRADGSGATLRTSWSANQQVGLREMLENYAWSYSPLLRMSTGAKHLHGDRPEYLSACKRLARFPSACTTEHRT